VIVVNGMAKSGTHAVMAWLSRMGLKRCPGVIAPDDGRLKVHGSGGLSVHTLSIVPDNTFIQAHVPASWALKRFSVVTIFRDPRNVLVSYVRHRLRWSGIELTLAGALGDFWGLSFVESYQSYLGWHGRSIVLRYEDLAADHVGEGSDIYAPDRPAWDQWIGNTRTGSPSDWREHWDDEAEEAWRKAGGPELLVRAGYEPHVQQRKAA
jgi:hypothetical protein